MERGRPSATAFSAARHRATHQIAEHGRIFADPLAIPILGEPPSLDDAPQRRAMRLFIAARTAFAERELAEAYRGGTRDVVVLGAGLDTFAYRHPYADLRVTEVDHPDTQEWKRERLAAAGIAVPGSLRYLPIDFERQTLADRLAAPPRTFFLWLGVVPYLTRAAFDQTLAFVAAVPGSHVVFDYAMPAELMPPRRRAAAQARAARVAGLGEPWRTFFTPAEIEGLLRGAGFGSIEDLGPAQLAARYFGRPDLPADTAGGHVVHAA
jgi:methyltransferase (TIGR00027 family)